MITRPLDLASKLRPEPRNFDWLFFVNAGLLVLFFSLFGSRFVLAPGLGVAFRLPVVAGANANARPPTHVITVLNAELMLTPAGVRRIDSLEEWLKEQAPGTPAPLLLVRGSVDLPISVYTTISSAAKTAGFEVLIAAGEASDRASSGRR